MTRLPCLCDGRADIRCSADRCNIAGPGEPGNPNQCRPCWLRLGKPPLMDRPAIISMGGGIGDALQGLVAVTAFQRKWPQAEIEYRVPDHTLSFVRLFDASANCSEAPIHYDLYGGYDIDCCNPSAQPRWLSMCHNLNVDGVAMPSLRDADQLCESGREYRGSVVLAPFSSEGRRSYPYAKELQSLVLASGRRYLTLAGRRGRIRRFEGEKVAGASASTVAAILLNAALFIGVDSGLSHLAGLLQCPALVLCGPTCGPKIFGCYPTVACLGTCGPFPSPQDVMRHMP